MLVISADAYGQIDRGVADAETAYFLATMAFATAVGLWAWGWRWPAWIGRLMLWWPVLVVMADLPNAFPASSPRLDDRAGAARDGARSCSAQMALSYPTGLFASPGRLAWVYIFILGYAAQVVQNVVNMLFWDLRGCPVCPPPLEPTFLHVGTAPFLSRHGTRGGRSLSWRSSPSGSTSSAAPTAPASYGDPPLARAGRGSRRPSSRARHGYTWYGLVTDNISWFSRPLSWVQTTGSLSSP